MLRRDPSPGTPAVVPFLTGARSTGWAARARLVMAGVTAAHTPGDLVRGAAEGLAIGYLRVVEQLREVAPDVSRVVASGSVTITTSVWLASRSLGSSSATESGISPFIRCTSLW